MILDSWALDGAEPFNPEGEKCSICYRVSLPRFGQDGIRKQRLTGETVAASLGQHKTKLRLNI